jgi:hypothetical protein
MHGSQMIYATRLSSPRGKYNSSLPRHLATAALVVLALSAAAAQALPQRLPQWREAPEYLRPFAPGGRRAGAFRIFVSPDDLETALHRLNIEPAVRPNGLWMPRPAPPLDAFGQGGAYDRSRVTRLYGSTRPRVARGTTMVDGTREFWTLISPHPNAALERLERGTLLLVLRYDGGDPGR